MANWLKQILYHPFILPFWLACLTFSMCCVVIAPFHLGLYAISVASGIPLSMASSNLIGTPPRLEMVLICIETGYLSKLVVGLVVRQVWIVYKRRYPQPEGTAIQEKPSLALTNNP